MSQCRPEAASGQSPPLLLGPLVVIVLDLDDRLVAFHLGSALDLWSRMCREAEPRVPVPASLEELRRRAWSRVRGDSERQEATSLAVPDVLTDGQPVMWLSVAAVARVLSVGERQVQRWVADGSLPSFKAGALRRIHAEDAADFADRRGAGVNATGPHRTEGGEGFLLGPEDPPAPGSTGAA